MKKRRKREVGKGEDREKESKMQTKTTGGATCAPLTEENNLGERTVLAGDVHDTPEAFVFLSILCSFPIFFSECYKMLNAFCAVA